VALLLVWQSTIAAPYEATSCSYKNYNQ